MEWKNTSTQFDLHDYAERQIQIQARDLANQRKTPCFIENTQIAVPQLRSPVIPSPETQSSMATHGHPLHSVLAYQPTPEVHLALLVIIKDTNDHIYIISK